MEGTKEIARNLNILLRKNHDSEKSFKNAVDDVEHPELQNLFVEKARQHYKFSHELKSEIQNFGEKPETGSDLAGDAQRTWMNIKAALSAKQHQAVVKECIKAEKMAIAEYKDVLHKAAFPPSTANLLIKQRKGLEESLEVLKTIEFSS